MTTEAFIYFSISLLFVTFILSVINFLLYRKRQIDKLRIIKYIIDGIETPSTINIKNKLFNKKDINYVSNLLKEMEDENLVAKVDFSQDNQASALWYYIDGKKQA